VRLSKQLIDPAAGSAPISRELRGFDVGLEPLKAGFALWFCRLCLGQIDLTTEKFHPTTAG
jgi:hypothetical protein